MINSDGNSGYAESLVRAGFAALIMFTEPAASAITVPQCTRLIDTIAKIDRHELASAMRDSGEGLPAGVNIYMNWRERGRVGQGNNANGFGAFVPWGQIFAEEGQNGTAAATIGIRRMQSYILSRSTQRWTKVSSDSHFEGALFKPNYEGNSSTPAVFLPGKNYTRVVVSPTSPFHFWPASGRVAIRGEDVAGVIVFYQARIDDPGKSGTRYLFSVGGDYWTTKKSRWDNYKSNGDAAIGRFLLLNSRWRTNFMTTSSESDLSNCINSGTATK